MANTTICIKDEEHFEETFRNADLSNVNVIPCNDCFNLLIAIDGKPDIIITHDLLFKIAVGKK